MTKVQVRFRLEGPLDAAHVQRLAELHSLYGIRALRLDPSLDSLLVEYDATRLQPADVEAALLKAGLPLAPAAA